MRKHGDGRHREHAADVPAEIGDDDLLRCGVMVSPQAKLWHSGAQRGRGRGFRSLAPASVSSPLSLWAMKKRRRIGGNEA